MGITKVLTKTFIFFFEAIEFDMGSKIQSSPQRNCFRYLRCNHLVLFFNT